MGLLYGRAGRLTAKNGGFRPAQIENLEYTIESSKYTSSGAMFKVKAQLEALFYQQFDAELSTFPLAGKFGLGTDIEAMAEDSASAVSEAALCYVDVQAQVVSSEVQSLGSAVLTAFRIAASIGTAVYCLSWFALLMDFRKSCMELRLGSKRAVIDGARYETVSIAKASTRAFCIYADPFSFIRRIPIDATNLSDE